MMSGRPKGSRNKIKREKYAHDVMKEREDLVDEFSCLDNIEVEERERLKHVLFDEDGWDEFDNKDWLLFYKDMGIPKRKK